MDQKKGEVRNLWITNFKCGTINVGKSDEEIERQIYMIRIHKRVNEGMVLLFKHDPESQEKKTKSAAEKI